MVELLGLLAGLLLGLARPLQFPAAMTLYAAVGLQIGRASCRERV